MGEDSTIQKKTKKLFGKLRRKKKDPADKHTATPPAVVNVNSPKTVSALSKNSPSTNMQPINLLPGFENKSGTVYFEDEIKSQNSVTLPKPKFKSSWLSRTKWFTKLSDAAFDVVDADESGEVDEKELYSGLLLIHLKLGCYAGPAACRPVDRQRVHDVFLKMDVDQSGSLDKEEFREVMMVLCSNIFTRVMVQCKNGVYYIIYMSICCSIELTRHSIHTL